MNLVRAWLPPIVRHAANRALGAAITYRGPYLTWTRAMAASTGYDQSAILERVIDATRKVLNGDADFEQDGVAFSGSPPASHALAGLLVAAARAGGRLSVLDLGGGLGSHFLRWRNALSSVPSLHWSVVEQPAFVAAGRQLFAGEKRITFHTDAHQVGSCPNAVLTSSTLQYLEAPHTALTALLQLDCEVIVLDRIPYSSDGVERIGTQHVPRSIGHASYPVWMLSRNAIHEDLKARYALAWEFGAADRPMRLGRHRARYHGSVWVRSRGES